MEPIGSFVFKEPFPVQMSETLELDFKISTGSSTDPCESSVLGVLPHAESGAEGG